jgi:hypothetical protein
MSASLSLTPTLSGVEVELSTLFKEFLEANRGKVLGVAVGDGAGTPLASQFDQPVNVGRLCNLGVRVLETGAILGECLSLPYPSVAVLRGERYQMVLWKVNIVGGPLIGLVKKDSEQEAKFKALLAKVEAVLTPPAPSNDENYAVT